VAEDSRSAAAATAVKSASTATKSREAAQTAEAPATAKTRQRRKTRDGREPSQARESRERRPRPLLLPVALGIVTLVLGGLAAWFGAEAHSLTSTPAAQNSALTDVAATSTVRSQISSAVTALFSYDYANPGPTTRAANRLLTGPAVRQYASLFAQVHKDAPAQKLIVTTAVTSAGVEVLTGDQARLLIFAAETDTHTGGGQPASAAAMLAVNAVRQGSTWKIEGIDTY
jgi:Mce-associated membrane protein